ncbi:hypothetical protein [Streptomyces sp. H39-S7]|uniref:hypothetical protein n=1 Tax=Streptomyces sp. H39-S7 TaxID=3004357 RepID=UPI0022AF316E|nr:hypothetical protein [Streptomyces sp. H39-S7]MCZ4124660.1 hypothetical protein [Streptomyces sp. H39-S7]
MDTNASTPGHRPTPAEAVAALDGIEQTRSAVVRTPIPTRFGALLVGVVVAVPLTQMLPGPLPAVICVLLAAASGAIGALQANALGFRGRGTPRDAILLVTLVVLIIAGLATEASFGHAVWWAIAAVNGVLMSARVFLVGRGYAGEER